MRRAGFSLIELLVVIAILGILAGIATYSFKSAGIRSRDSSRRADIARISNALQQYYIDNKKYPNFDTGYGTGGEESGGSSRMYSATWQLSSIGGGGCNHSGAIAPRLTPIFLTTIPEDPLQKEDFAAVFCNSTFLEGQTNRYYYLSGPSTDTAVNPSATSFALMAHLERPKSGEELANNENPLIFSQTNLGSYYSQVENYQGSKEGGIASDVNYAVFGRVGR